MLGGLGGPGGPQMKEVGAPHLKWCRESEADPGHPPVPSPRAHRTAAARRRAPQQPDGLWK